MTTRCPKALGRPSICLSVPSSGRWIPGDRCRGNGRQSCRHAYSGAVVSTGPPTIQRSAYRQARPLQRRRGQPRVDAAPTESGQVELRGDQCKQCPGGERHGCHRWPPNVDTRGGQQNASGRCSGVRPAAACRRASAPEASLRYAPDRVTRSVVGARYRAAPGIRATGSTTQPSGVLPPRHRNKHLAAATSAVLVRTTASS